MLSFLWFLFFNFAVQAQSCLDIFDALPPHVRVITNTYAKCAGPNCHNAVAYWHFLTKNLRPMGWRQLQKDLSNSKKFRKLSKNESSFFGDVIVFRFGPKDTILHSTIYLSEKSFWEKEGDSHEFPWKITPSADVYKSYEGLMIERYRRL